MERARALRDPELYRLMTSHVSFSLSQLKWLVRRAASEALLRTAFVEAPALALGRYSLQIFFTARLGSPSFTPSPKIVYESFGRCCGCYFESRNLLRSQRVRNLRVQAARMPRPFSSRVSVLVRRVRV